MAKKDVFTIEDLKSFKMEISYKSDNGFEEKNYTYFAFNDNDGHWTVHVRNEDDGEIKEVILHKDFLDKLIEKAKASS